ncbi:MAG: TonB-dependent receptor [Bacteroidales bacterium]|jgi:iron complex outermembrane receptor protein|nr:TonB-dependent receptor [Bacteroidales bacterium]
MAGYSWQHFWKNFNNTTLDPEGNTLVSPVHTKSEYYLISYYGRLNYSFDSRYLLTATFRADASSKFSKSNRWGYFPSAAFAWKINDEPFMKNSEFISNLKLRLSYGETGQQDISSDYPYLSTYTASYNEARYRFGNDWLTTYRPDGYDPNIQWETTATYNLGIDFGFFKDRITGSVDVYKRYTRNLLNEISVPAGSNFTNTIYTNIGKMKNEGFEFSFNSIPVSTSDLNWNIGFNFTWNKSEITKLNTIDTEDNYVKTGNADINSTGRYLQIHKVGETPYTFFLLRQAYDENGKPVDGEYLDGNGNTTTSEEDANKYVTGKSALAPYLIGFSTKINYKKWDFGMNGHGSFGNYVFNYTAAKSSFEDLYSSQGTSSNILASALKSGFTQQRLYSDYFLENASFFRIDNITAGYTFNKVWNTNINLRLSFTVQNVAVITGYSGIDPEIYSGIDNNVYQRPRIFLLGINLNF